MDKATIACIPSASIASRASIPPSATSYRSKIAVQVSIIAARAIASSRSSPFGAIMSMNAASTYCASRPRKGSRPAFLAASWKLFRTPSAKNPPSRADEARPASALLAVARAPPLACTYERPSEARTAAPKPIATPLARRLSAALGTFQEICGCGISIPNGSGSAVVDPSPPRATSSP